MLATQYKRFEEKQKQASGGIILDDEQLQEYHTLKEEVNSEAAKVKVKLDRMNREQRTDMEMRDSVSSQLSELNEQEARNDGAL